jgi:hypothetical protein
MVAMMIVIGVAVFAFAIAVVVYLLAQGSHESVLWRATFDDEYDGLVASGDAPSDGREAAWQDFHAAQLQDERDRRSWTDHYDDGP